MTDTTRIAISFGANGRAQAALAKLKRVQIQLDRGASYVVQRMIEEWLEDPAATVADTDADIDNERDTVDANHSE